LLVPQQSLSFHAHSGREPQLPHLGLKEIFQ
jgi:hypothetical protein